MIQIDKKIGTPPYQSPHKNGILTIFHCFIIMKFSNFVEKSSHFLLAYLDYAYQKMIIGTSRLPELKMLKQNNQRGFLFVNIVLQG